MANYSTPMARQRRLWNLDFEIEAEAMKLREDPQRSGRKLRELRKEKNEILDWLHAFESDPMTAYVGM